MDETGDTINKQNNKDGVTKNKHLVFVCSYSNYVKLLHN